MGVGSVNGLPVPPYEDTDTMRLAVLDAVNIAGSLRGWIANLSGDSGQSDMRGRVQRTLVSAGMEPQEAEAMARRLFVSLHHAALSIELSQGYMRAFHAAVERFEETVEEQRRRRLPDGQSLRVN